MNLRYIYTLTLLCTVQFVYGQVYTGSKGYVSFFSETVAKNIFAENKLVTSILNPTTNEVAVRIVNQNFKFDNQLMEEHFNEKYIESATYPTSTFAGKITTPIDYTKEGTYEVSIRGKFKIHGIEQEKTILGKLSVLKNQVQFKGSFRLPLDDYKIVKPTLVYQEIADELEVKIDLTLVKK